MREQIASRISTWLETNDYPILVGDLPFLSVKLKKAELDERQDDMAKRAAGGGGGMSGEIESYLAQKQAEVERLLKAAKAELTSLEGQLEWVRQERGRLASERHRQRVREGLARKGEGSNVKPLREVKEDAR